MTVKHPFRVLYQDLSVAAAKLTAELGEGFEIYEIGVTEGVAGCYPRVILEDRVMTAFPAVYRTTNVIPVFGVDINFYTFFKTIRQKYPDVPLYRVPEGKTFILDSGGIAGKAYILYKTLEVDQIPKPGDPGTATAPTKLFVSIGQAEASIDAEKTAEIHVNKSLNPLELPGFPYINKVPAGFEYDFLGFATREGAGIDGVNVIYHGLRMWKKEIAFLAEDEKYVNWKLFPYNNAAVVQPMFLFPERYTFVANEQLKIEVKVENTTTTAVDVTVPFATFWLVRKVGV